jgi:hypothetical protein
MTYSTYFAGANSAPTASVAPDEQQQPNTTTKQPITSYSEYFGEAVKTMLK